MNFFRRLRVSKRRQSDTTGTRPPTRPNNEFEDVDQGPRRRSLGTVFSRSRSRHSSSEQYTTDFWVRNFADKSLVSWLEFRAAFVLDYKNEIEEFSDKGHLSFVLDAAREQLCNKDSIVHITRYKKFVGADTRPDAAWNKIKEEVTRRLFTEAVEDSLCL